MKVKIIFYVLGILLSSQIVRADICTSTGTGNWNSSSTWNCGHVPASTDTVIIASGHVVTVNCNCGVYDSMRVEIYGELHFDNGQKLSFDINSVIQVYSGGSITGGNPGSKIIIGGVTKWDGGDPDIIGPSHITSTTTSPTEGVLPIELISFNVELVDGNAEITWVTAAEIDNDYFIVDRSNNLLEWENVVIKGGAGNSTTTLFYSAYDNFPLSGKSYYSLSQVDFNGALHRFDPVAVNLIRDLNGITVWPNPVTDYFVIELPEDALFNIQVRNSLGQLCSVQYEKRKDRLIYDGTDLSSGLYIISIDIDGEVYSRRILVN